ncbi:hypothetical protein [Cupriavidus necator]
MQSFMQRNGARLLLAATLTLCTGLAMAGGLEAGTAAANQFKVWFYGFVGTLAFIYLAWTGLQCWGGRANWVHDFGGACAGVAAVGATVVLAPWLWNLFVS